MVAVTGITIVDVDCEEDAAVVDVVVPVEVMDEVAPLEIEEVAVVSEEDAL